MCQVYQRPLTIIVDASVKKKHTSTQHMHACRISLCQPKHNGQGQWLFPIFLFLGLFLLLFVVSLCLAPLPCPLHPSVRFGTSAGVGCVGLTSAGSLVAGGSWTESMSSQRKRDRVHSKCGEKGSTDQHHGVHSSQKRAFCWTPNFFLLCQNISLDLFLIPSNQGCSNRVGVEGWKRK